jgi:hypothetical protein
MVNPASVSNRAIELPGYIQVIVSEFDIGRVEQIGLALEAHYPFEQDGGDGVNELVYTTTEAVLDVPIPAVSLNSGASAATASADLNPQWSAAMSALQGKD